MRVFITGVAGFLGSHLADAFLARGDAVSGVDNLIGGYEDNVPVGVDWYRGDCNDFERIRKALRAVDVVYHCAATAHEGLSVFSPAENARHGYAASASVFSAACAVGVKRVVFCSSMARYGSGGDHPPPFVESQPPTPEDPYGIGKVAAEQLLQQLARVHGIEWSIAVPHNIYGSRQKYDDVFRNVIAIFTNRMLQGKPAILYGDGQQTRCFSYVSDVVEPLVKMAVDPACASQIVNVGPDDEVVSVKHVALLVLQELGRQGQLRQNKNLGFLHTDPRPCEVRIAHCSADKARTLLGYAPQVSLEEGIAKTVAWIAARGPRPFSYHHLDLEIDRGPVPTTWSQRLL